MKISQDINYRPTWAETDLSAIRHNFNQVKALINKGTKILVAVKANAYGHGMLEVSNTLIRQGVDYLGVGTTDEAVFLRRQGVRVPILMLGSILPSEIEAIVKYRISQTVGNMELARALIVIASV